MKNVEIGGIRVIFLHCDAKSAKTWCHRVGSGRMNDWFSNPKHKRPQQFVLPTNAGTIAILGAGFGLSWMAVARMWKASGTDGYAVLEVSIEGISWTAFDLPIDPID